MTSCNDESTEDDSSAPSLDYKRFYRTFSKARGAVEILIVSTFLAFGIGSVIGLVRFLKMETVGHKSLVQVMF